MMSGYALHKEPSTLENNPRYGFQFWTNTETINGRPIDIGGAKGNGGQRIFFCKSLSLLVVITAGNYNQWDIKNDLRALLLNYVIPAIQ